VGSFWWKDILKFFEKFQTFTHYNPNRGNSMLFWTDIWIDQPLKDKFPQLYSITRKPKYSVRFFLNNQLDKIFSPLPLPLLAANQLAEAQNLIQSSTWDTEAYDSWLYS
jgi:hypothetical protein